MRRTDTLERILTKKETHIMDREQVTVRRNRMKSETTVTRMSGCFVMCTNNENKEYVRIQRNKQNNVSKWNKNKTITGFLDG